MVFPLPHPPVINGQYQNWWKANQNQIKINALFYIAFQLLKELCKMDTVKNVVRNVDISKSFYFIIYWVPCLSRENVFLFPCFSYKQWKSNFPRCSTREITGISVFKMLFVTLPFKNQRCTFWLLKLFSL